jgi:hypothetical protein
MSLASKQNRAGGFRVQGAKKTCKPGSTQGTGFFVDTVPVWKHFQEDP